MTCGAFTAQGEFLEVPEFDMDRPAGSLAGSRVCSLPGRGQDRAGGGREHAPWPHSGFSVDQSVFLAAGDQAGIERLTQYMTRCPFSLSRLVKVTEDRAGRLQGGEGRLPGLSRRAGRRTGVRAEAEFPGPRAAGFPGRVHAAYSAQGRPSDPLLRLVLEQGPRNAPQGGRRSRGGGTSATSRERARLPAPGRCSQTWAMLIKRVYEIDPLACPKCGGRMKVIAFIEPPQGEVIERILRHCGLWHPSTPRPPPADSAMPFGRGAGAEGDDAAFGLFGSMDGSDAESAEDFAQIAPNDSRLRGHRLVRGQRVRAGLLIFSDGESARGRSSGITEFALDRRSDGPLEWLLDAADRALAGGQGCRKGGAAMAAPPFRHP